MTVDAAGEAELMISDDGIGPPAGDEADAAMTMGSTLIAAFAKQLGGVLTVAGPPGSTTIIRFNLRSLSSEGSEPIPGPGNGETPARDAS